MLYVPSLPSSLSTFTELCLEHLISINHVLFMIRIELSLIS